MDGWVDGWMDGVGDEACGCRLKASTLQAQRNNRACVGAGAGATSDSLVDKGLVQGGDVGVVPLHVRPRRIRRARLHLLLTQQLATPGGRFGAQRGCGYIHNCTCARATIPLPRRP